MDQARLSPATPTSDAKPKAYSYLRFSTLDQMRGDSHRRQTELARQYAVRHGLDLDDNLTFNDLGVSAFRGRNAKAGALRAFLDAVEYEYVPEGSYLLVESLDRLSRDEILSAQGLFMQIVSAGINLVTLQDGRCYSKATINANPTDLIISIVTMMRAHEESATKQRRLKAVWQHKRDRAPDRPITEKAPAWLRLDRAAEVFVVIPERAEVVRRIYSMADAGIGYERIARTLNGEGVATFGRSRAWHRSYIVKLLSNEAVIGTFTPHVTEYLEGHKVRKPQAPIADYFPAIIDQNTFERMKAQRSAAKAPAVRGSGELRNLLANLANCPHCGSAMTRVTKGSSAKAGKPYLVCVKAKAGAGCTYHAVTLAHVEQAIVDDVGFLAGTAPTGHHDLDAQLRKRHETPTWRSAAVCA